MLEPFFKSGLTLAIFQLLRKELKSLEILQSWNIGHAKTRELSFKNLPNNLSMPAALDAFKPLKYLIFFQETSLKVKKLNLLTQTQKNTGPKNKSDINFSTCHWNLNSIAAHNDAKVSLLKAYITVYKLDIVCISETYLDSSITSDIWQWKS